MTPEHVAFLNTLSLPAAIVVASVIGSVAYVFGKMVGGK